MADRAAYRGTILIIDDDPTILTVAHDVLTEAGYRVAAAPTHDAALTALTAVRFALILCDTGGAGESGPEARWVEPRRILAAARGTPVVIFSAHDPGIFAGFHERGFAGVIAKPFDVDELVATVRHTLHRTSVWGVNTPSAAKI